MVDAFPRIAKWSSTTYRRKRTYSDAIAMLADDEVLQILVPTSSEEVALLDGEEDEEEGASSNQELVLEIKSLKSKVAQLTEKNIYLRSLLPSQVWKEKQCDEEDQPDKGGRKIRSRRERKKAPICVHHLLTNEQK
uniref:Uncharacterized protein n=1 Tax=Nelumbo nucifera TaxID=4432 RepID=A0A822Z7Y3_NELNU|nr:TPA_asm: hypothetical protein HUJ06_013898 [Nelumbo nucifera]DAD39577.1 TPA_asm: hypothetical protein HUJ06_013900 [Nelumbo nucifera]